MFLKPILKIRFNSLSLIPNRIINQDLEFCDFGYKNMEKGCFEIFNTNGQNLKNDHVWMKWIFERIFIFLPKYMC